jgi:hypothetical protein
MRSSTSSMTVRMSSTSLSPEERSCRKHKRRMMVSLALADHNAQVHLFHKCADVINILVT